MFDRATLITGAGGFIGAHLVKHLLALDQPIHVMVRPSTSLERLRPFASRLQVHRVDLCDREEVRRQVHAIAPNRVFHLAAETSLRGETGVAYSTAATEAYLKPTLNLLEALAALSQPPGVLVRAGTIAEHGQEPLLNPQRGQPKRMTAYGNGMLATTDHIAALAPHLPFPVITARLALCYGPQQARSFLIPTLIDACLSRRPVTVSHPMDRRDLLYVDEAVDALMRLAQVAPRNCRVVNICTGTAPSMDAVATMVEALTDCPPGIISRAHFEPGDEAHELRADPALARKLLGWESRIDLAEGLARTVAAEVHMRMEAG